MQDAGGNDLHTDPLEGSVPGQHIEQVGIHQGAINIDEGRGIHHR